MNAFVCLGTIAGSLVLIPAAQPAGKVIPARLDQLVDASERIVLVTVVSGQDGPGREIRRARAMVQPGQEIRRARATVKEVWKGPKVETIEYRISPCCLYDISKAVPGETVLLFLTKEDGGWGIAWEGRGRMTLETQDSKEYLSYFYKEMFPAGTPSVAFTGGKKDRVDRGVELKLVKELVDKAIAAKK